MKIGEIFLSAGLIQKEHLQKALSEQENRPGDLLGDILIDLGFLKIGHDNLRVGEILLHSQKITQEQLEEGLRVQQKVGEKKFIGEILVDLGYLDLDGFMSCLSFQLKYNLRKKKR